MPVEPGQSLLHYRIVAKLGEGGMGEVWRAVDTTLDRPVAIKVLPEIFSQDSERLARFEREAKLLGSLNHPNIATVHGLHEADGSQFLAMELVDGEDLAARLARAPLPVDEALAVCRQVAAALEAAHSNGVVHRDLKPANIVLTADGQAKVLDFGLAKAAAPDASTRDGNRILYMHGSADVYQVDVRTSPDFSTGEPAHTFDLDANRGGQSMDASHDGKRMLVAHNAIEDDQAETRPRITVVLNWFDEIEERTQGSGSR